MITRGIFLLSIGFLAVTSLAAVDAGWLENVAVRDLIPEFRLAAGLALVDSWAVNKTVEELQDLAVTGATHELRLAAALALSKRWLGGGKTYDELLETAETGASEELQLAAVDPLMEHLIQTDSETLEDLYTNGTTFAVRYAAAKAYFFLNRREFDREALEEICKDKEASDGYKRAAAELLAGHYMFPSNEALSMEELETLANTAETPDLRLAAATALVTHLIKSELTAAELRNKLVDLFLNPQYSDECRWAYARALAARWAAEL